MKAPLADRVKAILDEQKLKPIELAKAAGVTKGLVSQWLSGIAKSMGYEAAAKLNRKYGYDLVWLMKGEGQMGAAEPGADYAVEEELPLKEQILLQLYRGLFSHQQLELVGELRALFQANQIVRKELGQKPLRGVSNEAVEKAFGKVPPTAKAKKAAKRHPAPGVEEDPE